MQLFHWVPHKKWKDSLHPMWSLEGRFLSPNAKELGICVTVNWYPPALSNSLDSEEGEGRVQWRGLECHVRCGICGVLWGVGSHVGYGKVNSNCFNNSETIAASISMIDVAAFDVRLTQEIDLSVMHKSTPVMKASSWLNLSFYMAVDYITWHFIRNSWESHRTVVFWPGWN